MAPSPFVGMNPIIAIRAVRTGRETDKRRKDEMKDDKN